VTDDPIEFLKRIWLDQPRRGWGFLAYFDKDHTFHDLRVPIPEGKFVKRPPNGGADVYFAPCLFSDPLRRKQYALPGRWLYADLDESDPRELDFAPTIAWQTSPGRYQAAWRLERPLAPAQLSALNQRVTYYTQADRGGWSLTKVLRLPGTESHKRDTIHTVHTLWEDGPDYRGRDVVEMTRGITLPATARIAAGNEPIPNGNPVVEADVLRREYRGKLPTRARVLLRAKSAPVGTRSERLWELENILLESGLPAEHVYFLVHQCVWNKHDNAALWAEVFKAQANVEINDAKPKHKNGTVKKKRDRNTTKAKRRNGGPPEREELDEDDEADEEVPDLPLISSAQAQSHPTSPPSWMVAGIWSQDAHGLLAGSAKSYKSTIALDLGISVASGTKFLNHFDVAERGPVLYIQEENSPEELEYHHEQILRNRGLALGAGAFVDDDIEINFGRTPPLYFLHNWGFDLREPSHLKALDRAIRKQEPSLVILDPFYRMARGVDENNAKEVESVLNPLLDLKHWHGIGILLIHHYRKAKQEEPAGDDKERISGSGVFGRWFESSVYAKKSADDPFTVILSSEHRGHGPQPSIHVAMDVGEHWDNYDPKVWIPRDEEADEYDAMRELVHAAGNDGIPVPTLADKLGMTGNGVTKKAKRLGLEVVMQTRDGKPPRRIVRRRAKNGNGKGAW
jgi:hypothetical protein